MTHERKYEIRSGVLFDRRNVHDTAQHCRMRNNYLQGKADSNEAATELLIAEVLQRIQQDAYTPGQLLPVFNAWAVVDAPAPGSTGTVGGQDVSHVRLQVNFFVRPGRRPALHDVGDSD